MNRTEKAISTIGWIFWFHVYIGLILFAYWAVTIKRDGPTMFMELTLELKVLWAIILSGGFFLYTLIMLRIKSLFDLAAARASISITKAQWSMMETRDRLLRELEDLKKKGSVNVADKDRLRESGQA